jgi:TRAP-type mannitol/chloroaromatic compound transport system permease small subunit
VVPDPTEAERRVDENGQSSESTGYGQEAIPPHYATEGLSGPLGRIHPIGLVAAFIGLLGVVFSFVDTDYLIGHLRWWHWLLIVVTIAAALSVSLLNNIRIGIEAISTFMLKGLGLSLRTGSMVTAIAAIGAFVIFRITHDTEVAVTSAFGFGIGVGALTMGPIWVLAWGVFVISLFSSLTRYISKFTDSDLIIAEVSSLGWQSFGLIAMLGLGYGVREGVNPRIDFWWADFSNRTKAWLDFVLHVGLLMPFLLMVLRILYPFARNTLGYKPDRSGQGLPGEWPSGWRIWETWEQQGDAGQLPIGPIQAMLFVAFVLFALQILAEVIKHGFTLIDREDLGGVMNLDAPFRVE